MYVIVTGGPGAGKTTLLAELAAMGFATVDESARAIIAERLARGASPRPDPVAFAREILRRDIEKYLEPHAPGWVFFDRSVIEALGMLHEASRLTTFELASMLAFYRFHATVFVLPPWDAIYANDRERDQSFDEAVDVHARVVRWYSSFGYGLDEVQRLPVAQRAAHVLRALNSLTKNSPAVIENAEFRMQNANSLLIGKLSAFCTLHSVLQAFCR